MADVNQNAAFPRPPLLSDNNKGGVGGGWVCHRGKVHRNTVVITYCDTMTRKLKVISMPQIEFHFGSIMPTYANYHINRDEL